MVGCDFGIWVGLVHGELAEIGFQVGWIDFIYGIGLFSNGVEWGSSAFSLGFPIGCLGVVYLEEGFSKARFLGGTKDGKVF